MVEKRKKLKLKPSARDKRRYFLVSASSASVEAAILEYIGVLGLAKSAYMFVNALPGHDSGEPQSGVRSVCSCLRESLNDVRASLAFKGIVIEKVSGTLKGLGI